MKPSIAIIDAKAILNFSFVEFDFGQPPTTAEIEHRKYCSTYYYSMAGGAALTSDFNSQIKNNSNHYFGTLHLVSWVSL